MGKKRYKKCIPMCDNAILKYQSSNYYKSLVESITGGKQTQQNLDKTNVGYTKYGSISAAIDDQTIRLKNDLSGVPFMIGDVTNMIGDYIENVRGGVITAQCNENWKLVKD